MNDSKYRRIFSDLPKIETEHLILKKMCPENAEDMFAYASLSEVTKYLLWNPHLNIDETRGYIEYVEREYRRGNFADWGITYKNNGTFIGTVGFSDINIANNSGEIGYVLNPSYQGRGLMTEAVKIVLYYGFEKLGIKRIQARIMEGNNPSVRLAERLGFKYEGTLRDLLLVKDEYRNIMFYSIIDTEYDPLDMRWAIK